jgi:hypothetical protein
MLHPDEALADFLEEHGEALSILHGCLEHSVAETFARWDDGRDPKDMDQSVLAGCVRQSLADGLMVHLPSTLGSVDRTGNCGVHLYLRPGRRTRVRKRPISVTTGVPMQPTSIPETLFGDAYPPYETAVLWSLNLGERQLASAVLAAATSLDEPHLTAIYAELALPPVPASMAPKFETTAGEPTDDFDDFLGGGAAAPASA